MPSNSASATLGIVVNDTKEGADELSDVREVCEIAPGHRDDMQKQGLADWLWKYMQWNSELYGADIPFQALYETAAFGEYRRVESGDAVFSQNEMEDKMYIIIAGCVCFVCDTMQIFCLGAGNSFGEFEASRTVFDQTKPVPTTMFTDNSAETSVPKGRIARRQTTAIAGPQRQTTEIICVPTETFHKYIKPILEEVDDTLFAYERAVSSFRRGIRYNIRWENKPAGGVKWQEVKTPSLWAHIRKVVAAIVFLLRIDRVWFERTGRRIWKHIHGEIESSLISAARKQMKRSQNALDGPRVGRAAAVRCRWILTGTSLQERPQVKEDHALARGMMLLQLIPFIDLKTMDPEIAKTTAIDLYQCMVCKDYDVDEVVFEEGSELDNLYVVMQGECEVVSQKGSKLLFPGDVCGMEDIDLVQGQASFKRQCTARARTLLSLAVVPQKVYLRHADSQAKALQRARVDFVQAHPFFRGLPLPWQVALASRLEHKSVELNDVLVQVGDKVEDVYFMLSGTMKSVKHEHAIPKEVDNAALLIQRRLKETRAGKARIELRETLKEAHKRARKASTVDFEGKLNAQILQFESADSRHQHRAKTSAALLRRYGPSDAVGVDEIVKGQADYDAKIVCTSTESSMLVLGKADYTRFIVEGPHQACLENMRAAANAYEHSSKGRMHWRKLSVQGRMLPQGGHGHVHVHMAAGAAGAAGGAQARASHGYLLNAMKEATAHAGPPKLMPLQPPPPPSNGSRKSGGGKAGGGKAGGGKAGGGKAGGGKAGGGKAGGGKFHDAAAMLLTSIRVRKPRTLRAAAAAAKPTAADVVSAMAMSKDGGGFFGRSAVTVARDAAGSAGMGREARASGKPPKPPILLQQTLLGKRPPPAKGKAARGKVSSSHEGKRSALTPLSGVFPNLMRVATDAIDSGEPSTLARLSANQTTDELLHGGPVGIGSVLPHGLFKHETRKAIDLRTALSAETTSLFAYTPKAPVRKSKKGGAPLHKQHRRFKKTVVRPLSAASKQAAFELPDWMSEAF